MTTTARLQLTKPVGGDSINQADNVCADAYTKIDAAMGVTEYAAKASAPTYTGNLIKETSSNGSLIYNPGVAGWEQVYNTNDGKGELVGTDLVDTSQYSDIGEFLTFSAAPFTAVAGRKYRVSYDLWLGIGRQNATDQGYQSVRFRWRQDATPIKSTDTLIVAVTYYTLATYNNGEVFGKNIKGFFEFFPNVNHAAYIGVTSFTLNNWLPIVGYAGSPSTINVMDWGV